MRSLLNQKIALSEKEAIDVTEFRSTPPDAPNYKFVLNKSGQGVFWVPPFELAGGMMYGEVWDKFEDAPTHGDVLSYLGWNDNEFTGAGYCNDGDIQVYTEDSVTRYVDQIFDWWSDKDHITWDGQPVQIAGLEWFKSANKKQKQRRRRNKYKNNVPYYGHWWAGWNPDMVMDHGGGFGDSGTTENSGGGDFVSASIDPIAVIGRVNHQTYPNYNSIYGTGIFEGMGYDPVTNEEVLVMNVNGKKEYLPPESVRLCNVYSIFPGGDFDEIAFILNGNESYVWFSNYIDNANIMPSHTEVAELLLGISGVGLYDITTGVLKPNKTLKVYTGDLELNEENMQRILGLVEGTEIIRIEWNGELIGITYDGEVRIDYDNTTSN